MALTCSAAVQMLGIDITVTNEHYVVHDFS